MRARVRVRVCVWTGERMDAPGGRAQARPTPVAFVDGAPQECNPLSARPRLAVRSRLPKSPTLRVPSRSACAPVDTRGGAVAYLTCTLGSHTTLRHGHTHVPARTARGSLTAHSNVQNAILTQRALACGSCVLHLVRQRR